MCMRIQYHGQTIQLKWEPVSGGSRISQTAVPTSKFGVKTYYWTRLLPKTTWKWKKLDREGARIPSAPHPGFANAGEENTIVCERLRRNSYGCTLVTDRPLSVTLADDGARFIRTDCMRRIRWSCEGLTSVHNEYTGYLLKHLLLRHMYNLPLPVLLCYAQALRSETSYCYCCALFGC